MVAVESKDGLSNLSRGALRFRRVVSAVCVGAMLTQLTACYTSVPVQASGPAIHGLSTITVNDRGRLLVGAKLGSLLDRVDGQITASDASAVQVTVATAYDVRGATVRWGGEPVSIPREGISSITQRRVEKGSTLIVLGAIAAGLIGLYAGLHHPGNGNSTENPDPGPLITRIPR